MCTSRKMTSIVLYFFNSLKRSVEVKHQNYKNNNKNDNNNNNNNTIIAGETLPIRVEINEGFVDDEDGGTETELAEDGMFHVDSSLYFHTPIPCVYSNINKIFKQSSFPTAQPSG